MLVLSLGDFKDVEDDEWNTWQIEVKIENSFSCFGWSMANQIVWNSKWSCKYGKDTLPSKRSNKRKFLDMFDRPSITISQGGDI
jgi:hypothetical protein